VIPKKSYNKLLERFELFRKLEPDERIVNLGKGDIEINIDNLNNFPKLNIDEIIEKIKNIKVN